MAYCKPPLDKQKRFSSTYQPKRRHTGPFLPTILRKLVEATDIDYRNTLTGTNEKGVIAIPMAIAMVKKVLEDGDVSAFREIMDRLYGKVPTPIQEAKDNDNLIDTEYEIIPNGDKQGAIERFKGFLS